MEATETEWFAGRVAQGKDWQEIVAWVGDLPPLPDISSQAIVLVENPQATTQQLAAILGKDPALAARVLKIANSAMFARQREITTLNQAINLIGFKALKGIIIAATLRQLSRDVNKVEQLVWENSTGTAVAAYTLAKRYKRSLADEAFMFGLLHDLGKLVLIKQIPTEYNRIWATAASQCRTFAEIEQEELGYAHPLIGALVAKKWNFSQLTCAVILHHHDPLAPSWESPEDELTALIQTADLVAHTLGYGHPAGYPDFTDQCAALLPRFGVPAEDLVGFHEEVKRLYTEQRSAIM